MTNKGFVGFAQPAAQPAPQVAGFLTSGAYYFTSSPFAVSTSSTQGVGSLKLMPWIVPNACTLSRMGAEVTSAGEAGSLVRLGLYADNGAGLPGLLVLDAGTIAGDSNTVQEISITAPLQPGLYWAAAVVQNVSVTQPTMRICNSPANIQNIYTGTSIPSSSLGVGCLTKSGVTGALPGSITSPATGGAGARTFVKIA